jgi:hypothetical protein
MRFPANQWLPLRFWTVPTTNSPATPSPAVPRQDPRPTLRRVAGLSLLILFTSILSPAHAEDTSLKADAKRAGHAIGAAMRDVGHGIKKAGKAIGTAAKEGAREFRRAIKGES